LNTCKELTKRGFEVVVLPVDCDGRVDLESAWKAVDDNTLLLSIQAANNEIGTIQPIADLASLAHERGALMHCDAAQAVGKVQVDVDAWDVDLLSLSAHKLYGPKGVGALYIRKVPYTLPLQPLVFGGGQEYGLRSGTLNVPGIVGLGEATALAQSGMLEESRRIESLRNLLEESLFKSIKDVRRNGAIGSRLPNNSSLTFPGIDAEALIVNANSLAISTGSACTSGAPDPSHVLLAIGLSRQDAECTIRIGLGRFTTEEEVLLAATILREAYYRVLFNTHSNNQSQSDVGHIPS
jgi:cysteine desulfurase